MPESVQGSGWGGALSYHESGHAVMMLRYQRPFDYIDMVLKPNVYWAAVVGGGFELTTPDRCLTEMKVAVAGSAARERCRWQSARSYYPTAPEDVFAWMADAGGKSPCDEGAFWHSRVALDELLVGGGQPAYDEADLVTVFRSAENEITGPLWPAVEALAAVLVGVYQQSGKLSYEQAHAVVLPLLAGAA